VRDNGRGIAQSQLARIFEPFVQADRPNDALRGGLGLGLAIVANLVERHGGTITAHSEGLGRGSAFTVELPTVVRVDEQPTAREPKGTKARGNVRVLVVDDNVDIAELMSVALELEGFKTAVAHQAQEAIDAWKAFHPHAAVLDVGLPDLDGYELAKTLRAHHGSDATLIAATGYGERKDRLKAAESGFDCHFVKPVSVHDLVRVLDERVVDAGRITPV
jgi:CheY-like chemotaxis protein